MTIFNYKNFIITTVYSAESSTVFLTLRNIHPGHGTILLLKGTESWILLVVAIIISDFNKPQMDFLEPENI